jgi:hypothetical protein
MSRFIVGTDRTTPEQDQAFYTLLRSRWPSMGWWHNLPETWLLIDPTNTLTVEILRDAAFEAFPGRCLIVIQVGPDSEWAGMKRGDNFDWVADQWSHYL